MARRREQHGIVKAPGTPEVLEPHDRVQLDALLRRDPAANLFALSWLESYGVRPNRPDLFHFRGFRDATHHLGAAALVITQRLALLEAEDPAQAAALGRWYGGGEGGYDFHHIMSASRCVAPFWAAYREARGGLEARLEADQRMYVLTPRRWGVGGRGALRPTTVGVAAMEDLEPLLLASALMHKEETQEDPLEREAETFRNHVRHRIESGRSFVLFDQARRLIFKADVSAQCSEGIQISGVYTAPWMRGRGVATRAMFDICQQLFDRGCRRISLYVNAQNGVARRVYERVGFEFHCDYQTIFLHREDAGQPRTARD